MVRLDRFGDQKRLTMDLTCTSADIGKFPTNKNNFLNKHIPTSSTMYVIDTGDIYMYTEDTDEWYPV